MVKPPVHGTPRDTPTRAVTPKNSLRTKGHLSFWRGCAIVRGRPLGLGARGAASATHALSHAAARPRRAVIEPLASLQASRGVSPPALDGGGAAPHLSGWSLPRCKKEFRTGPCPPARLPARTTPRGVLACPEGKREPRWGGFVDQALALLPFLVSFMSYIVHSYQVTALHGLQQRWQALCGALPTAAPLLGSSRPAGSRP